MVQHLQLIVVMSDHVTFVDFFLPKYCNHVLSLFVHQFILLVEYGICGNASVLICLSLSLNEEVEYKKGAHG